MKKIFITIAVLTLCGGTAFSQSNLDAYKYSQSDLNGTARYLGMGGAFGALGGDVSAMKSNPAGLAVYRSSEVVTTISVNGVSAESNWLGTKRDEGRTNFTFDNIAYVGYFPTGNSDGVIGWNVGFAYNRLKNFGRNYTMATGNGLRNSLSDYVAARAFGLNSDLLTGTETYSPYREFGDWQSVLGYNAGYMNSYSDKKDDYYSVFGELGDDGNWYDYGIYDAQLQVRERGAIDQYNIAFGVNVSDVFLFGGTMSFTDLDYRYESFYDERFEYENNDLYLDNALSVDGTGYSFNLGVIVRPNDYLRLGVAYNSPTWYNMTDRYYGEAGTSVEYAGDTQPLTRSASTPRDTYTDYKLRTPDKWIFSAAAVIGQTALLSMDYELTNYRNMHLSDRDGISLRDENQDIKDDFRPGSTFRIGTEIKVTPQFAVRAGGSWSNSPFKDHMRNNRPEEDNGAEVYTVGTIPHYTVDKGISNYSIGFGYRFTPNFYMDLACVYAERKEDVYAFSNIIDGGRILDGDNTDLIIATQEGSMKTKSTRVALTLGYKF